MTLIALCISFIIPPANEVTGVYSDPYVRPFVRPFVFTSWDDVMYLFLSIYTSDDTSQKMYQPVMHNFKNVELSLFVLPSHKKMMYMLHSPTVAPYRSIKLIPTFFHFLLRCRKHIWVFLLFEHVTITH